MDPIVGHQVEHARCLVELKIQALPSSRMDRFEGLDTVEMDTRLNRMNKDTQAIPFENIGYLKSRFTNDELVPLRQDVLKVCANFESSRGHNNKLAGKFCFQYTNSLGDICNHFISADRSLQNQVLLFSGKMKHTVFPFYSSDDYRISVAGNFAIKGKND